ncbi:hypothetical protein A2U01_0060320, partial [Trifolium medium]|nr:hypothetical protein [Trifolium medium]
MQKNLKILHEKLFRSFPRKRSQSCKSCAFDLTCGNFCNIVFS